ncbi:IS110 family transposase [Novipirellula artificiosorum]|uniref:Transposase n=1 Tax=Novipirellula artificiosorum TaxID=2528016 RepID=A0A5C6DUF1_9BACT|nr:transposase [Novipirellula artificiosorum]TWU39547.1 Transposase [Novipirellula artificiosorum]
MSKITYHVGLDYHQHSIQVCVMDKQGNIIQNATRPNDWRAVAEVVPEGGTVFAAIEACCGAADFAEELINHTGWSVNLAHPGYVARIKQSPDKTDWADAKLLADLQRVGYLPKVWLAPENIRELRRLVRYRQQQVNHRRNVKLRVRALLRDQRAKSPAGFTAKIHSHGSLRAVVIKGQASYLSHEDSEGKVMSPGSYFHSQGESTHHVSTDGNSDCIIYVRSEGKFDVIP